MTTSSHRDTMTTIDIGVNFDLWHYKLGHISGRRMKVLVSNGNLPDLKFVEHQLCESCILGKTEKGYFF